MIKANSNISRSKIVVKAINVVKVVNAFCAFEFIQLVYIKYTSKYVYILE